jgi:hypothetical protein
MARLHVLALLGVALLVGCGGAPDGASEEGATGATEDPILGGQVETSFPSVGMVRFASGSFGSGVLVAPNVVLTAGHVARGNPTQFFYGTPAAGKAPIPANLRSARVKETLVHPCYTDLKGKPNPACSHVIDVALVRLEQDIVDVAPVPMEPRDLRYLFGLISPWEGETCVAVGFGAHLEPNGKATIGTRRSSRSTISDVDSTEVVVEWTTGIATSGDSGGPLICGGKIVGTVRGSVGAAKGYERTNEGYIRVDLVRGWVNDTIAKW